MKKNYLYLAILLIFFLIIGLLISFQNKNNQKLTTDQTEKYQEEPTIKTTMNMPTPVMTINKTKQYQAVINTDLGDITIELNAKNNPVTVNNFVYLARKNFYNDTIFHRTINKFMIQGGDPVGDGTGGPGYNVVEAPAADTKYIKGLVAMAKKSIDPAGTSGSQFFIMHDNNNLPPEYAVLGKVISGLDIVDKIATAPTQPGGEGSTPINPVEIKSVEIIEK